MAGCLVTFAECTIPLRRDLASMISLRRVEHLGRGAFRFARFGVM
jgi:hypothetical protein